MKIAFMSAELAPFVKTGGLGDVAAALPACYRAAGHDVRVFVPYYTRAAENIDLAWDTKRFVAVQQGGFTFHFGLFHHVTPEGVDVFFIRHDELFGRAGVYCDKEHDYADNPLRFALYQQAVLESFNVEDWIPDVVQMNDWHTALMPAYLAERSAADPRYGDVKTVFTIHNLAYQGICGAGDFWMLNLPDAYRTADWVEHYGMVNCIKAALLNADWLTTVSPTYAREIQMPESGCGFDGLLRERADSLTGILNGIDTRLWDPMTDPKIPWHYHAGHFLGKYRCKRALLKRLGLPMAAHTLLCGLVARLTDQKGIDLVLDALDGIVALGVQMVVLGTGGGEYEAALRARAAMYPDAVSVVIGFDDGLAHQIEAGGDVFLMPSRFEPCGLNQMYSLRYGTVPVVRRTGGLADTVVDTTAETLEQGSATGFVFDDATPEALLGAIARAVEMYRDSPALWRQIRRAGMAQDLGWTHRAGEYLELFGRLLWRGEEVEG